MERKQYKATKILVNLAIIGCCGIVILMEFSQLNQVETIFQQIYLSLTAIERILIIFLIGYGLNCILDALNDSK